MSHVHCEEIQMKIYRSRNNQARMLPLTVEEWEQRARELLAPGPFDYVYGAAGAGDTLKANLDAFQRYRLRPRMCTDVTKRDLSVQLLGQTIPFPFLMAPVGVNSILHPDAEKAPAKAAADLGVPYILSNVSTTPMEEIAEVMEDAIRWFQLYPPRDHELTKSFLHRAEKAGFSAIVVTVDSTLLGWRVRDLRNAYLPFLTGEGLGNYFTDPVFRSMLKDPPEKNKSEAVQVALDEGNNTAFSWKDFEFIKQHTKLPVLIKGLTHPEDALLAVEHGADGIIVSNHGGRQVDGAVSTLESLPGVVEIVQDRVPVLMDSGIRRAADILKAISLGARAVLIGRPYAYALAVAGEQGVRELLEHFIAETELQLAICGKTSMSEVDNQLVLKVQ